MAFLDDESFGKLRPWIRKEVLFQRQIKTGNRGKGVERIQEWLSFHGNALVIDGDFGKVTRNSILRFQEKKNLSTSGKVDKATFGALTAPMRRVLRNRVSNNADLSAAVAKMAQVHLAEHPIELGGQNRGPWVRLYMEGSDGPTYPWCAGFVTFLAQQAAEAIGLKVPIRGSSSCDSLASQAKNAERFVHERDVVTNELRPGFVFLVRRTATDWVHTGVVTKAGQDEFLTIEGNTNDTGSREGFEVCARARGYSKKDFIDLSTASSG